MAGPQVSRLRSVRDRGYLTISTSDVELVETFKLICQVTKTPMGEVMTKHLKTWCGRQLRNAQVATAVKAARAARAG